MEPLTQHHRRVLIVGLGKTGLSCARFLAARGVEVAITDTRPQPPELDTLQRELPDVALFLNGFDDKVFASADELVLSPGVSMQEPVIQQAIARGVPVLGDIELFARTAQAPVIAITGSNGKSTVTTLVGIMAREAGLDMRVGGNLGTPALDLLEEHEPDGYVLELSSFQLETTASLCARAAVVLNVSLDHMDRYAGLEQYAAAKQRVYRGDGVMVLNADDPCVMKMQQPGRRVIRFTLHEPQADEYGVRASEGELWLCRGADKLLPQSAMKIKGLHNVANALAALALGEASGFEQQAMLRALGEFPGLAHRTQWVAEQGGVCWYNDSKATNVGATVAAVAGLSAAGGKLVLIAGGDGKGADFSPLRGVLQGVVRSVVLMGRDAPLLEQALQGSVPLLHAADMRDAVRQAYAVAQPGDTVLLSPACASLDMYRNYEERGADFIHAVQGVLS